ncbi:MAG TPA: choice-of-anchor tandem repeat GloVer-containing protein [Rhizomicrobium sp.]|jgi:uncharacterized repeat protein (TIGR03803 family)|nr:choice-of-anchor tandem repeat GloVer-containing protein [Rhizomicrobium sp.]
MRISHTLFHTALLGSTLAVAALAPAAAASLSLAEKRALAVTGNRPPASRAVSGFSSVREPGTYTVLHNFTGGPGDGQDATAEPTLDKSGNIYGVTEEGGANDAGALFEITAGGSESLLHSFGGAGDGTAPDGAVSIDSSGNIIGTTNYGGASDNGTIWELAAKGTYSVLHSFAADEGNFVRGHLVQDKKGNFYGTALFGGTPGYGTVFEYSAKGKLTILHAFDATDGEYPEHGVVMDKDGNLYGATAFGGADDNGTVYKISSKGSFTSLYSFTGGADGGFIYGGIGIDKKGNLYGSTVSYGASGNGTVFKMTSAGALTTLYNFTGGADGGGPEGDTLVVGKNIYGAATTGGSSGDGGIYEVTTKGKETMVQSFDAADGDGYSAGLTASGKFFYGTTAGGGTDGYGVVFSLTKK